jgi:phage terminase small subunit
MDVHNFHLVKSDLGHRLSAGLVTNSDGRSMVAAWLQSPDSWDRAEFAQEVVSTVSSYDDADSIDGHLIALLATQMDVYVAAWKGIASEGLIADFNGGQTSGRSLYLDIADRSLKKIVVLMAELRLTPKERPKRKPSGRIADFLNGP